MQQPERCLEQVHQVCASSSCQPSVCPFLNIQARLDQFDVPVAKLRPKEIIDAICGLIEPIGLQRIVHVLRSSIEARKKPPVFERRYREIFNSRQSSGDSPALEYDS